MVFQYKKLIKVKCNKCGIEFNTRYYKKGDQHKYNYCMGYFIPVKEDKKI